MRFNLTRTILILLLCVAITPLSGRTAPAAEEYQIKAVFLYNFANFITWPKTVSASFSVCVLGDDPFGQYLDSAFSVAQKQQGRWSSFEIRRTKNISETKSCHILFISESEQSRFKEIVSFTKNYAILTISDTEHFIEYGGMIEFFKQENRIKLSINSCTLEQVGLKAAADLLRIAKIMGQCN